MRSTDRSRWQKRGRVPKLCLAVVLLVAPAVLAEGCRREADLLDEPDGSVVPNPTPEYDGDIPLLDAGVVGDAYGSCEERPVLSCKGANDFVCGFPEWIRSIARECQKQTQCMTNGWLSVELGNDGCVSILGMDHPNDMIVDCLVARFSVERCPCPAMTATYYFGAGNSGKCPDGGPKG